MVHRVHLAQRCLVDDLHQARLVAGAEDVEDRPARRRQVGEVGDRGARQRWQRHELHRDLGDHAEHALGADEHAGEVEARGVLQRVPTGVDDLARGEHDLEPDDVVAGDAVADAAQTAGVGGDVAADAGDLVRRRVGWVEEAVFGHGPFEVAVEHARLHAGHAVGGVDRQHRVHAVQREDDAAVDRVGAAAQSGARPAGDDRDPGRAGCVHGGDHVGGGAGHDEHGPGAGPFEDGAVVRVGLDHVGVGLDAVVVEPGAQRLEQ